VIEPDETNSNAMGSEDHPDDDGPQWGIWRQAGRERQSSTIYKSRNSQPSPDGAEVPVPLLPTAFPAALASMKGITSEHTGEWAGGGAPPASRRTGREPLSSSGSHHPAYDMNPNDQ
jgi:hypothetical protein